MNPLPLIFRPAIAVLTAAAVLAGIAGCADDEAGPTEVADASPPPSAAPAATSGTGAFPLEVDNCGQTVTIDAPPERVVTIHQHPAEVMLSLGLESVLVGTAYPDNDPLPDQAERLAAITELSNKQPSFERVIAAEPDLVYGGYDSAFAENDGLSRDAFTDAGIDTYLNLENCRNGATMTDAYSEIRQVAEIFGVSDRADELIEEMEADIAETTAAVAGADPLSVFAYDSGEDAAFTVGGKGLGDEIIELAGGTNIFADVDDLFADVSWEQVAARNPEVIVIVDYFGSGTIEDKKRFLLDKPELQDVPAIRNQRFFVLPLAGMLVGVRPPQVVSGLARALHPQAFTS